MGVFANHDIALQFLFVSDGKIFPITRPTIALANSLVDPPVYVGSMSDKLDEAIPIKVAADEFQGWFTTLIPKADAQSYHLQYAVEAPDIIQGPPSAPGANDGEAPSMGRLKFGPDVVMLAPVIAALPKMFTVSAGGPLPIGEWKLVDPQAEVAAAVPLFEVW